MTLDVDLESAAPVAVRARLSVGDEPVALLGPNGSGKTTLLLMILGVRPAGRGRVELAGETLYDSARGIDLPVEARRLGYVPQRYALFPHLSVRDNVAFGAVDPARVGPLLDTLEIADLADRRPASLSGGEAQRVALARALAAEPRGLLLDEPLAALDVSAAKKVRAYLGATLRALRLPTLVVTHDPEDAAALAARVAVMEAGRIVQEGTLDELRARPASRFVSELLE
ncbi:MAG TPA: ATP-binding cassette domain-containing protein [Haliangiales bacterium]|nr:ATP-binding cassette domain-containing protein [Haliangiales bacterium]